MQSQVQGDWFVIFIKPDGETFQPAAMFPDLSICNYWLEKNYQGEHEIRRCVVDVKVGNQVTSTIGVEVPENERVI